MRFKILIPLWYCLQLRRFSLRQKFLMHIRQTLLMLPEAEKFLRDLPTACSGSYAYASCQDGTVNIRVICIGPTKAESMDGLIAIKNGVVTKVK